MKNNDLNSIPLWITKLEEEDLKFIKEFVLTSGSLKEISKIYDFSYPTGRLRLDRLIEKIKLNDKEKGDSLVLSLMYCVSLGCSPGVYGSKELCF